MKNKNLYLTNINGKKELKLLNQDDLKDCIEGGILYEKIDRKHLVIETETKELGSCGFCGGAIVADSEKITYKGEVVKNHNPSWGACWDCGAI